MAAKRVSFFRRAWQQAGLSTAKVVATALAAIAMALIAPRITGLTSSLIAVGLISVTSAVVNAFISSAAEATADSAKRLASVGLHGGINDRVLVAGLRRSGVPDDPADERSSSDDVDSEDAETGTESPDRSDEATAPEDDAGSAPSTRVLRLQRLFRSNYIYVALFAVIAVVTIYASWAFAQATGDTTYIRSTTTTSISAEERQAIVDDAVAAALSSIESDEIPVGETDDGTPVMLQELLTANADLTARLEQLESTSTTEQTTEADLVAQIDALTQRIAELEAQLVEAGLATPAPTSTPTPTPTPTPGVEDLPSPQ